MPMTRKDMLQVNKNLEDDIEAVVTEIYKSAIEHAKNTNDRSYNFPIAYNHAPYLHKFYIDNMPLILAKLKPLFPDSSVHHAILARGIDGRMYDISCLNDYTMSLVEKASDDSHIVINWA